MFQRQVPATRENAHAYDVLAKVFDAAGQWGPEAESDRRAAADMDGK